jgi:cellobiose-specific phosphotransferase system component IIB
MSEEKVDVIIRVRAVVSKEVAEALEILNAVNMRKTFFTSFLNIFDSPTAGESYSKMVNFTVANSNLSRNPEDKSGVVISPQISLQMPTNTKITTDNNISSESVDSSNLNKSVNDKVKDNKAVKQIQNNIMNFDNIEKKEEE